MIRSGAGRRFRKSEPLAIDFPNGRVIVEPNEIAEMPDGTSSCGASAPATGRNDEYDGLEYTLYQLAGQAHFGGRFVVEALHLTDERLEAVEITDEKFGNRRTKSDGMLGRHHRRQVPDRDRPRHLPALPAFLHLRRRRRTGRSTSPEKIVAAAFPGSPLPDHLVKGRRRAMGPHS